MCYVSDCGILFFFFGVNFSGDGKIGFISEIKVEYCMCGKFVVLERYDEEINWFDFIEFVDVIVVIENKVVFGEILVVLNIVDGDFIFFEFGIG